VEGTLIGSLPPVVGTIQFDMPHLIGAVAFKDIQLDKRVRIGPLKLHDRTGQRELPRLIEHRKGMMRKGRAGSEQQPRRTHPGPSKVSN